MYFSIKGSLHCDFCSFRFHRSRLIELVNNVEERIKDRANGAWKNNFFISGLLVTTNDNDVGIKKYTIFIIIIN